METTITLAEIHQKYNSEWILLEEPQTDGCLKIENGKVLWHSKDRNEVYRKARELNPKHAAILYTGKLPQNTVIIL